MRYDLRPGEVRKIDNGHLVAWHGNMQYTISKASSGIIASVLSGEGLVCTFTGPGTIYIQTRSLINLASELAPYLPSQGGGGGGGGGDFGDGGFQVRPAMPPSTIHCAVPGAALLLMGAHTLCV
eukprot:TRINITY_DN2215_c1_g1_i1.p2 TRINITY_DN2215_c1_g1~~TRINITY_DN2215_c1_g1_i1.p2  ORF type:complete len:124 (-),score=15.45 TRINITY_DN2215_c1_g1_i1:360-731(-)